MPSSITRRPTTPRSLAAVTAVALLALTGCGDDDDDPAPAPGDTSSENVQGGTELPGDEPSVQNTNVGNPAAPQDPIGSGP